MDQKSNPAYPGFYNGGGSRPGGMARRSGDISPVVGSRGKAPVCPPEAEAKCEISVQLLTFSYRKFRI